MKIALAHYKCFSNDGVTIVLKNNLHGLRKAFPEQKFSFKFLSGVYEGNFSEFERVQFPFQLNQDPKTTPEKIVKNLEEHTQDCESIIIENPMVGSRPYATIAFKEFSEKTAKKRGQRVLWRHHDFIDDRPSLFDEFKRLVGDFNSSEPYSMTDNVTHITLTTNDQERLKQKGIDAIVLRNSVITDHLYLDSNGAESLRKDLEQNKILFQNEKVLLYPVRIFDRKNIEEALLLTKILQDYGEDYRLIVTAEHNEEYEAKIKILAEKHNIKLTTCIRHYIQEIRHAFSIAENIVTTSVNEGFGFAFVEPWLASKSTIGRDLPKTTSDLKQSGLKLDHLYTDQDYHAQTDINLRFDNIDRLLSDKKSLRKLSEHLNLPLKIAQGKSHIDHNNKIVREKYDSVIVAKQLYELLKN